MLTIAAVGDLSSELTDWQIKRYLFDRGKNSFLIEISAPKDTTEGNLATAEVIIKSLEFIDSAEVTTESWQTFTNNKLGLTLKYPPTWIYKIDTHELPTGSTSSVEYKITFTTEEADLVEITIPIPEQTSLTNYIPGHQKNLSAKDGKKFIRKFGPAAEGTGLIDNLYYAFTPYESEKSVQVVCQTDYLPEEKIMTFDSLISNLELN